jgi:dihydropyrimidinase
MSDFDTVIRNARIVNESGQQEASIGIRDGRIAAIAPGLAGGAQTIDADGLLALPGGIDAHCHIEQMVSTGARTVDTFASASVAAVCGGTTTILPFAAQHRGQRLPDVVADATARAAAGSVIDYGFHLIVTDATLVTLQDDLPALVREGFTSVKIYLTYDALRLDDRSALDVLLTARREGAVPLVHAESHDMIAWLVDHLVRAGHTEIRNLAGARPVLAERDAVHHAISLAELAAVPIVLVHMSSKDAIEQVRWARQRGMPVYAETCPQYLVLTADALDAPPPQAVRFCCSPPLRDIPSQDALWAALADGTASILSSDHSAFDLDGANGKLRDGLTTAFHRVSNGLPGLETRLPLVFSEGVAKGRLSLERFVAVSAAQPARLYGLWPRKGSISVGADADIALWDPQKRTTIRTSTLNDGLGWTPYEGFDLTGWPVHTISRGKVLVRNSRFVGSNVKGELLRRSIAEHGSASWSSAPFDPLNLRFKCEATDK